MTIEDPEAVLTELKSINEQLAWDIKIRSHDWKRNNPVMAFDEPIQEWLEQTITPNQRVSFTFNVPGGHILYMTYAAISFYLNSTYRVIIDGRYSPVLTDSIQDFGDHWRYFTPPRRVQQSVTYSASNFSGGNRSYNVMFNGWLRRRSQEEALNLSEKEIFRTMEDRY